MDDRETLRCATECATDDPPMGDSQPDDSPESLLSAEAGVDQPPSTIPRLVPADASEDEARAGQDEAVQVIEAILFSSDTALSAARLADLVGSLTPAAVRKHIASLNEKYESAGLSFRIEAIAKGYQMMTLPDFQPWIIRLNKQRAEARLSDAALETLSIVAYKQPIIRADIEAIRGVAVGEVIRSLMYKGLVKIVGRAEVLGRPILYGTTKKFLEIFGLNSLKDLPKAEELKNPDR